MIKGNEIKAFDEVFHEADFCVAGGGMAGMLAAVSAARHGLKVVLIQDRPVLGGNASGEVRMWIRGAHGESMKETGLLEEIALDNIYYNPTMNYSYWDCMLINFIRREKNITLLLNCSVIDAKMQGDKIESVKGWQGTTQKYHTVKAKIFADCSGDSILAPLTGASFRMGRESSGEFSESIAPEKSDSRTMGLTCLMQIRETEHKVEFTPPPFAEKLTAGNFINKMNISDTDEWKNTNFWWIELGGTGDTIGDTEELTEKLINIAWGVWDFIKNKSSLPSDNWELEWLGTLAGKRESRRYEGLYMLNQNDVEKGGHFSDIIAYGGWTMDDHNPEGFSSVKEPTVYHPAPSPYGIPLRCLISSDIKNLTFAGRNISATHSALSSVRVMATCGIMGQALGTAAAKAVENNIMPRELKPEQVREIQQELLRDDCYIPFIKKEHSEAVNTAIIKGEGNINALLDGYCRKINGEDHAYEGRLSEPLIIELDKRRYIKNIRLILDSDLDRKTMGKDISDNFRRFPMRCNISLDMPVLTVPGTILRDIKILADGKEAAYIKDNHQRLLVIPVNKEVKELTVIPLSTWGTKTARIYDIDTD